LPRTSPNSLTYRRTSASVGGHPSETEANVVAREVGIVARDMSHGPCGLAQSTEHLH
jgi:hypothetical protein